MGLKCRTIHWIRSIILLTALRLGAITIKEANDMKTAEILAIEAEAKKELAEDRLKQAKIRIKAKLTEMQRIQTIQENLMREYQDLLAQIEEGN